MVRYAFERVRFAEACALVVMAFVVAFPGCVTISRPALTGAKTGIADVQAGIREWSTLTDAQRLADYISLGRCLGDVVQSADGTPNPFPDPKAATADAFTTPTGAASK